ncbi:MAG: ketosteroid isomerase [Bauldia sp.]|nr:ketosteroid isomerase [Bauldia sp.]
MPTEPGLRAHPDDIAAIRGWFETLAALVRARDFPSFRPMVHDDFLAFGTFSDFLVGREQAEQKQWRNVWPTISGFRFRDDIRVMVSPDRLFAVGLAIFDSTGYAEDGTPFDRPGRATVSFDRARVGDPFVANHTHMSLFRDVPDRSFGETAA